MDASPLQAALGTLECLPAESLRQAAQEVDQAGMQAAVANRDPQMCTAMLMAGAVLRALADEADDAREG